MAKKIADIDDFIDPHHKIDIGIKINPKARIVDFADMKIDLIAPNIKGGIEWHLQNAQAKLKKLRGILEK